MSMKLNGKRSCIVQAESLIVNMVHTVIMLVSRYHKGLASLLLFFVIECYSSFFVGKPH